MPQRNFVLLALAVVISMVCYLRGEQNPFARYTSSSYSVIDELALMEVPDDELFAGAMSGMVDVLERHGDEHSRYITRDEAIAFEAEMRQEFGGIGVRVRIDGEPLRPIIVGPPEPGTPAYFADIRAGDVILEIDGQSTADWDMLKVLRNMRGEVGSPLVLTLLHPGETEPVVVDLVREEITIDSILGDRRHADGRWQFLLDDDPRIAYVRIIHFGDKTVDELSAVMAELTEKRAQAVILDLRDNAGGALDAAVAVCDMFLADQQLIVETRGRNRSPDTRYVASGAGKYQLLPLAVIINQFSASASEIVAACLQDNQRAVIIGQRSYGKGTVQRVLGVGTRGRNLLKLTSASYWRPSGANIHRMPGDGPEAPWGVMPDDGHVVELSEEQYIAYRRHRSDRDLMETNPSSSAVAMESADEDADDNADSEDEENGGAEVEFVDQALLKAVEYLQAVLAG